MCSFIYTPENYAWHIVSSQQLAKVRWRFAKLRYFWGKIRGKMVFEVLYFKTFFLYYNSYFNISSLIFMSLPGHLFEGLSGQRFPSPFHWTVSELQKVNLKFQCTCNKRQKLTLHNKASRSEERKRNQGLRSLRANPAAGLWTSQQPGPRAHQNLLSFDPPLQVPALGEILSPL